MLRFESSCLKTHGKLLSAVKDEWVGTPDFTLVDAAKALKKGKVTVYSSYPIENGVFVTPSKMEAESYAGDGKVYSKEMNLDDVAWIDSNEGQVAVVPEVKYSSDRKKHLVDMTDVELNEQKNLWNAAIQEVEMARRAKAPGRNDISKVSSANLGKINGISSQLDGILDILNKRPMNRTEFIRMLSGSLGVRNNDARGSKYVKEPLTIGNGEDVYIRISNHSGHAINIFVNGQNGNDSFGSVIEGRPEEFDNNKRPRYIDDKRVNNFEMDYYTERFDDVDDARKIDLEKSIVEGWKHFIETGELTQMPLPDRANGSGVYKPLLKQFREENPQTAFSVRTNGMDADEARRVVTEQIKHLMSDKNIDAMQKKDLNKMLNQIRFATPENIFERVQDVQRTVRGIETRVLGSQLNDLLKLKMQDVNGKNQSIAKTVDNQTRMVTDKIRDKMYGVTTTDADQSLSMDTGIHVINAENLVHSHAERTLSKEGMSITWHALFAICL